MKQMPLVATFVIAMLVLSPFTAVADSPPLSKKELESLASHVFAGVVLQTYVRTQQQGNFVYEYGVVEVDVKRVDKGSDIAVKDRAFIKCWKKAWTDNKQIPPPDDYGQLEIPRKGDAIQIFASGDRKTGFDALSPNGFTKEEKEQESENAPQSRDGKIGDPKQKSRQGILRTSPNGKLAAGVTVLHEKSGMRSVLKIWADKERELLHQFPIPGKVRAIAFSPDSSTVVAADRTGNLARVSTIRAWDLSEGTERKIGTCVGEIGDFCFSPDGVQLAAVASLGYFDNMAELKPTGAFAFQIKVWRITGEGNVLSINIPHPLGEWVEVWPPIDGWSGKRIEAAFRRVVPTRLRFSSDGKQLICETEAGLRTIYDSRTGSMLQHSSMSSVGVFKSMLMIALHQVPADVKSLTIEITPREKPTLFKRGENGLWRIGTDKNNGFRVDDEHFVSLIKGVEKKEHFEMRLGLKDETNLAELLSFRHPLGVIKIKRDETGLKFRLEEVTDGIESGETLQAGEVRWGPMVNE